MWEYVSENQALTGDTIASLGMSRSDGVQLCAFDCSSNGCIEELSLQQPDSKRVVIPSSPSEFRFDGKALYRTGQTVPESGIYKVLHTGHRLPHEVTLLKDQHFPRCSQCEDLVEFEAVSLAPTMTDRRGKIVLYELPEIDQDPEKASA